MDRTKRENITERAATPVNKETRPRFGALKAVLSATFTDYKARSKIPTEDPSATNRSEETVAAISRIKNLLSRVIAMEERFGSLPDDVEELNRRDRVIRYVTSSLLYLVLSFF